MATIFWFKRDLRVQDNPALLAAGPGPVLPIYIAEPEYWALPDTSARQWAFIAECLRDLRMDCPALVIRKGDAIEVLEQLRIAHRVTRLVSHEETGNLWTFARDRRIADWAQGQGVEWVEVPQGGVVRRLGSRDGWAGARDRFLRQGLADARGVALSGFGEDPGGVPTAADLGCAPDPCPARQAGGRRRGLEVLDSFLTERGRTYRKDMSTPVAGERACSRLSAHLAVGSLSVREVAQAAGHRKAEVKGTRDGWGGSLKSFTSRLAWRHHFMQKLEDEPGIETRCLHPAYEGLRPEVPDAARLAAWERGETGVPFADACMRYLNHGGWLNFRMRSMLVAYASYHLWLDWRATGPHLARVFTDYEPGIHWSQIQMQSGTTGMNTVRIYNPVKQGHDQDPDGVFTRRWLPELAQVPDRWLQEPWKWEGADSILGRTYPAPIVDVTDAARSAREKVWGIRKGAAFREEASRIVRKHASRKDRGDNFRNDRQPRRRKPKAPPAQLSLDL